MARHHPEAGGGSAGACSPGAASSADAIGLSAPMTQLDSDEEGPRDSSTATARARGQLTGVDWFATRWHQQGDLQRRGAALQEVLSGAAPCATVPQVITQGTPFQDMRGAVPASLGTIQGGYPQTTATAAQGQSAMRGAAKPPPSPAAGPVPASAGAWPPPAETGAATCCLPAHLRRLRLWADRFPPSG